MASSPTRRHLDPGEVAKCGSYKVGYATREAAFDEAERQMLRGSVHPGCHITPYLCDECGEWHVGNRTIVRPGS